MSSTTAIQDLDAVVIGAGFAGLYANYRLRDQLGLTTQVYEAGDNVGGTWYWNRYPGARCDSESYMYCFSFDKQLMQEWEWSGKYPEQPEILSYLSHVADRFDLRRNMKLMRLMIITTPTRAKAMRHEYPLPSHTMSRPPRNAPRLMPA